MDADATIVNELEGLRARYDAPYNPSDKLLIRRLYREVLGKEMRKTSCQTCYHDAVVEMYCYIKNKGRMAKTRKYLLKAGAVIQNPNFEGGKVYTNVNLTDAVAEKYLKKYPGRAVLFQRIPKKTANKAPQAAEDAVADKVEGKKGGTGAEVQENGK